jgi:hypothetical protein
MRTIFNNKGISLVVLIVIMLGIGLIGGGVATIMSSKQKSYPFVVNSYKAYEIANAGAEFAFRYAVDNNFPTALTVVEQTNVSFGGGTFTTTYISGTDTLESTATFRGVTRVVRLGRNVSSGGTKGFSEYVLEARGGGEGGSDINFGDPAYMAANFLPMESQSGQAIVINPAAGTISLGQGVTETFGAVWYSGNNAAGDCINGSCNFGTGFRAHFVFQFATGSTGDGFTFAVINGNNNTASSVGGDTRMGELMAYGGDSRLYDSGYINAFSGGTGNGIQPPKFAVEFDIFYSGNTGGCSPPSDPCGANSRCDPSAQHMAYVFWGNNNRINCQDTYTRWLSSFSFLANTVVYGTTGGDTYLYHTTNTGMSSTTQPSWPSGKGFTNTESTGLQWQECSWRASTSYRQNDVVAPSASYINTSANGFFFRESRPGNRTTGGSEPDWRNCVDSGDKCPPTGQDGAAEWQNAAYYGSPSLSLNYITNSRTYDDNKHTAGTGTNAGNSSTGAGPTNTITNLPAATPPQIGYYTDPANPTAWLSGNPSGNPKYAYRMEVVRDPVARTYRIKSWIKTCTDGTENCDMYTNGIFGNVGSDYNPSPADNPALDRTISLDATYNTAFNKFLFGWTVATGGATQIADVRKFRMKFKPYIP